MSVVMPRLVLRSAQWVDSVLAIERRFSAATTTPPFADNALAPSSSERAGAGSASFVCPAGLHSMVLERRFSAAYTFDFSAGSDFTLPRDDCGAGSASFIAVYSKIGICVEIFRRNGIAFAVERRMHTDRLEIRDGRRNVAVHAGWLGLMFGYDRRLVLRQREGRVHKQVRC